MDIVIPVEEQTIATVLKDSDIPWAVRRKSFGRSKQTSSSFNLDSVKKKIKNE